MKSLSSKLICFLSVAPLLWVAWFYFYVVRQRLHLGFWPRPSWPDPKGAGYIFHHSSIYLGVLLVPVISIVVIGLIVQRRLKQPSYHWWFASALLLLSVGSFLGVMFVDPGDYWIWFLD